MATKKSKSSKKSAKRVVRPRGNTYELTAVGLTQLAEVSGQGKIIRDALKKSQPISASSLLAKVEKALHAPNPSKTLAWYLSIWHKAGFVKFGQRASKAA